MYTITGTVDTVGQVQQVTERLSKREFVLFIPNNSNPQYPDHITFQALNAKCSTLDGLVPGQQVEVSFYLNGRKVTNDRGTAVFNALNVNEVKVLSQPQQQQPQQPPQQNTQAPPQQQPPQQAPQQGYQNPPQPQAPPQQQQQGAPPQQGGDDLPF